MSRILIIGYSSSEQRMLEEEAIAHGMDRLYEFETTASFGQDAAWWKENRPSLLVIMMPGRRDLQGFFLRKMRRDLPSNLKIMVVAEHVDQSLILLSNAFRELRMIKAPVEGAALLKSIHEFLAPRPEGKKQRHQRYPCHIPVELSYLGSEKDISLLAKNISIGGIFMETEHTDFPLGEGDSVSLKMHLLDVEREYKMDGQIVWLRREPDKVSVGVQFVDKEDVYESLLAKF